MRGCVRACMSVLNQTHRTLCIISELVPCYHRFITDAFCCMKILSEEKEKKPCLFVVGDGDSVDDAVVLFNLCL